MKIFYSWQSDLPNSTNRGFIEEALEKAVKAIRNDDSIQIEPVIERDTVGVPGSPNIATTILEKIEQASIFVCDVSIINSGQGTRPTPNPNVLIELGYALKTLGAHRIIMVQNTVYGSPEKLPFDLKMNRTLTYSLNQTVQEKALERNRLAKQLETAIRLVLSQIEVQRNTQVSLTDEIKSLLIQKNEIALFDFLSPRAYHQGQKKHTKD